MSLDQATLDFNLKRLHDEALQNKGGLLWEHVKTEYNAALGDASAAATMNGESADAGKLRKEALTRVNGEELNTLKGSVDSIVAPGQTGFSLSSVDQNDLGRAVGIGQSLLSGNILSTIISVFTLGWSKVMKAVKVFGEYNGEDNKSADGSHKKNLKDFWEEAGQKEQLAALAVSMGITNPAQQQQFVDEMTKPIPPGALTADYHVGAAPPGMMVPTQHTPKATPSPAAGQSPH